MTEAEPRRDGSFRLVGVPIDRPIELRLELLPDELDRDDDYVRTVRAGADDVEFQLERRR